MSTKPNNASIVETCTQRLNALKSHASHVKTSIPVNGTQVNVDAFLAMYQACLDIRATLNKQRADVKATLTSVATADAKRQSMEGALKAWVVHTYGADSTPAHDFGFPPPKKPVRTVESKVTALVRNKATRNARHTMGSKQRLGVKGTMVVLTEPADPANTVQPAATSVAAASTPSTVVAPPVNGAASSLNGAAP